MKRRTCPNCDYKYSFIETIKLILIRSNWSFLHCKECKCSIEYKDGFSFATYFVMVSFLVLYVVIPFLKGYGLNSWQSYLLVLPIFLLPFWSVEFKIKSKTLDEILKNQLKK